MKVLQLGLCVVGLLVVVGCSESPYPTAPVRGTVKVDGQPMRRGKVMFAPVAAGGSLNSGRPAFGDIQDDGSFTVSTYRDGDGAVVGEHWISVINTEADSQTSLPPPAAANATVNKSNFRRIVFPRKTVSVVADQDNQFDIAMTSADIAKYGKRRKPDN